ncbi:MAG: GNAT family N-acetyltransferase [Candidatus Thorarchaeota archaeon]
MTSKNSTSVVVRIEESSLEDIPELTLIMTRAFDDDSQKHLSVPKGGPPGYDNGDFLRKWMPYDDSYSFKILAGTSTVGHIIVWVYEHGNNHLGNIFVDPNCQDQGIGYRAWNLIEEKYPGTTSWTLGTPSWALKNHHFYEKCGFVKIREEHDEMSPIDISFIFHKKFLK